MKPIPFDSLVLAAVTRELQPLVGGRLQRAIQPNERTLVLGIYAEGKEQLVLLSCSTGFARVHLTWTRPAPPKEIPLLTQSIRRFLDGARVVSIRQIGFDRQLELRFQGDYRLIAELTGKHANLVLVGPDGKVVAAAHHVPPKQSVRPIQPGRTYEPPPFPPRKPVYEATEGEDLNGLEGASPFVLKLAEASGPGFLQEIGERVRSDRFEPVEAAGWGAYPVSVAALGYGEARIPELSPVLDAHFRTAEASSETEAVRARLLAPLRRVLLAREVAIEGLHQAVEAAQGARRQQELGELILAFAHLIEPGASSLAGMDYAGDSVEIPLDPEKTPPENAQRYFDKAKHAKARASHVADQLQRLSADRVNLIGTIRTAEDASDLESLLDLEAFARERGWLRTQVHVAKEKEDRPFEGHKIRERLGPGGLRILYGENATSNDYLTMRVAKPNDIWLHVRGSASAHVVIVTGNKPEKVGKEALEFAARLAVQNSSSKHSKYVPVDYTLKKYVRKPKGSPAGTASYTHEKTVHVEG